MNRIPPVQKARMLLKHINRAETKLKEREQTRIELHEALARLRTLSTASLKKYVDEVESKVNDLMKKEQKILSQQEKEESVHQRLLAQLDTFENKLTEFLEQSKGRQELLEQASAGILPPSPSAEEADIERVRLQGMLEGIEFMYESLQGVKGISKEKLEQIKQQINTLKEKLS